jgi:hypothetical protein
VAGPEAGTGNVQFQSAGSERNVAWAATQERLFIAFDECAQTNCFTLPTTLDSMRLSSYRRSVLVPGSSTRAYLIHNTQDAVYCFAVSPSEANICARVGQHNGRGAWVEGGSLYLFGMRKRKRRDEMSWFNPKRAWVTLNHGIATLMRIDLQNGCVDVDSAADTKKTLRAAWIEGAAEGEDRDVKPLLEAWVGSVETVAGRVLIGAIADERRSESDDTFEEPTPLDFEGVAFYRRCDGKVALLRLLRGIRYVSQLRGPSGAMLFFMRRENQHDAFSDRYFAMLTSVDMQSSMIPLVFDWEEGNLRTVQFDPSYDDRVGFIAAVTTQMRDAPLPYRRHFAMSTDGIAWHIVDCLPDQREGMPR